MAKGETNTAPWQVGPLLARARRTNQQRDVADKAMGSATPTESSNDVLHKTAMDAILAGLTTRSWDCAAEGYPPLEALHVRLCGRYYQAAP